jgi:hypothetical protein
VLGLVTLAAVGLGGWQYWENIRPMWEMARAAGNAEDLSPEERALLQKLAWNREAWRSGLIDWLRPEEDELWPLFGVARIVYSGTFCDADGSNHRVFVFSREVPSHRPYWDLACVVTDDTYNLRLWRVLDEAVGHGDGFGSGHLFEKAAIQSDPSPILEISFKGWGTYRYRRLPESLDLTDVHLTNDSEVLNLNKGMRITDPLLAALKDLEQLRRVYAYRTDVGDAQLVHFESLSNLERLDLSDTRVTPEGVKKLQQALPDCVIVY